MKVLKIFQRNFPMLGICPRSESSEKNSLNSKNKFVLFASIDGIISCCVHLAYIADSFEDYTNSIYSISATLTCTICYASMIWKMPTLFRFIDELEQTLDKSEFVFNFKPSVLITKLLTF